MNWNAVAAIATAVAAVVTAAGFMATVCMILAAAKQARTDWEDDLTREYREIMRPLPSSVRLNGEVGESEVEDLLPAFLSYFDLSNQQAFLRKQGRVSGETWKEWRTGIGGSLQRGAIAKAWIIVKQRSPDLFTELKELETTKFETDPIGWKRPSRW